MPKGLRFFLCGSFLLASIGAATHVGAAPRRCVPTVPHELRARSSFSHSRSSPATSRTGTADHENCSGRGRGRRANPEGTTGPPPESTGVKRIATPSASAGLHAPEAVAPISRALHERQTAGVAVPLHEEQIPAASRKAAAGVPPLPKPSPARPEVKVAVLAPPSHGNEIESPTGALAEPVGPPFQCPDRDFVDDAGALPSPCRYGVSAPGETFLVSLSRPSTGLNVALDALARGDLRTAKSFARRTDLVTEHIVSWIALISGAARPSSSEVDATMRTLQDWPGRSRMRGRYEEALARERPSRSKVLQAFAEAPPSTIAGTVLYAKALQASGRTPEARDLIGRYWRESVTARDGGDQAILSNFASLLSPADHQARVARLLRQGKIGEAESAAALLDENSQEQFKAWIDMRTMAPRATMMLLLTNRSLPRIFSPAFSCCAKLATARSPLF